MVKNSTKLYKILGFKYIKVLKLSLKRSFFFSNSKQNNIWIILNRNSKKYATISKMETKTKK